MSFRGCDDCKRMPPYEFYPISIPLQGLKCLCAECVRCEHCLLRIGQPLHRCLAGPHFLWFLCLKCSNRSQCNRYVHILYKEQNCIKFLLTCNAELNAELTEALIERFLEIYDEINYMYERFDPKIKENRRKRDFKMERRIWNNTAWQDVRYTPWPA
jgi:hypothetical protein